MIRSIAELKALFEAGDTPARSAFVDLIDTMGAQIPGAGIVTPAMLAAGADNTQLISDSGAASWAARDLDLLKNSFVCEDVTNTDAYELTLVPAPANLAAIADKPIFLRVTNTNTTSVTLNLAGSGITRELMTVDNASLPAGYLRAGGLMLLSYNAAADKFFLLAVLGDTAPTGPAGGALSGTYPNPDHADDSVATDHIEDGAVTEVKIGADAITAAHLNAGSETEGAYMSLVDVSGTLTLIWVPQLASKDEVTQTSHGFVIGDVLHKSGSVYVKSQADTAANAAVAGVVTAVADTHHFTLTFAGPADIGTGRYGSLVGGTDYYLDASTAGDVTGTAPAISKVVFQSLTSNTGLININPGALNLPSTEGVFILTSDQTFEGVPGKTYKVSLKGGGGEQGDGIEYDNANQPGTIGGEGAGGIVYVTAGSSGDLVVTVGGPSEASVVVTDDGTITAAPGGDSGDASGVQYDNSPPNYNITAGTQGADGILTPTGTGINILLDSIDVLPEYGAGGYALITSPVGGSSLTAHAGVPGDAGVVIIEST